MTETATATATLSQRRPEKLAVLALIVHVAFFALSLWLANVTGMAAAAVLAWSFLGGVPVWMILLIQFHQRRLARQEQFDIAEIQKLRHDGRETSVFEGTAVDETLHLAGRHLQWIEKYLVVAFAVLGCAYQLGVGWWQWTVVRQAATADTEIARAIVLSAAAYLAGMALVSFLLSRYAAGLSRQADWRPIRAGGSYLLANALGCLILAAVMVAVDAGYTRAERVAGYVLVAVMLAVGVETAANLLLDMFRPRVKGRYHVAPYDSRLLGLFSEPGDMVYKVAHALDYQFGFNVSDTWFFRLLMRAFVPLVLIQILVLYAASSLVVIEAGEVGVRERWGKPVNLDAPLEPGLHLKWPWPWPEETVRTFPVGQIQTLQVGYERFADPQQNKPLLWTIKHWKEEYEFMTAVGSGSNDTVDPNDAEGPAGTAAGFKRNVFDLMVVALAVNYRISDVTLYGYGTHRGYEDPQTLIESVCHAQLVHYCAGHATAELLGTGRLALTRELSQRIQRQLDELEVGVTLTAVNLEAVHPPMDVAESFQKVVAALQDRQAAILQAQGQSQANISLEKGKRDVLLAYAQSYAASRAALARGQADRFDGQIAAWKQCGDRKDIYYWRRYLSVLDETLPPMRKYLMASDRADQWVYELDLKEKIQPDLFEGLNIDTVDNPDPRYGNELVDTTIA